MVNLKMILRYTKRLLSGIYRRVMNIRPEIPPELLGIIYAHKRMEQINIGKDCRLIDCTVSSEPYLVTLGNHVSATRTHFETHDGGVWLFREENPTWTIIKPIKIGNNVYIGTNCIILPGVIIGDNVIIGAGSIVTKNIPSNTVYAGIPARFIKTVEEYKKGIMNNILHTKLLSDKEKEEYLMEYYRKKLI